MRPASVASPSITGMIGCSPGQLETELLEARAEMTGVLEQLRAQLRRVLEQVEHPQRHGGDDRRDAVGEEIGPRALPQPLDDLLARGDVSAAGAAQRLAERAREDVDRDQPRRSAPACRDRPRP